jgi:hypothetical protein
MIVRHGQRKSLSFIFHEHIVYLHEKTKLTSNFFFCPLAEGVGFNLEEAGSGFTVTPAWFIMRMCKGNAHTAKSPLTFRFRQRAFLRDTDFQKTVSLFIQ